MPDPDHCPDSTALCGSPGPMVLEMADGHVSSSLPTRPGVEAENGCVNLVKSLLVGGAVFPRKPRGSWPWAHLQIAETQSKLAAQCPGIPECVTSVEGRCAPRFRSQRFPGAPARWRLLFPVAWLKDLRRVRVEGQPVYVTYSPKYRGISLHAGSVFTPVFKAWKPAYVMVKPAPRRTG